MGILGALRYLINLLPPLLSTAIHDLASALWEVAAIDGGPQYQIWTCPMLHVHDRRSIAG